MSLALWWGTAGTLFLTGLLGSTSHCLGMCGPLVILAGSRFPRQGLAAVPYHLLYNLSKAAIYAILGLVIGGLGKLFFDATSGSLTGLVSVALGLAVIFSGLAYLGLMGSGEVALVGKLWSRLARRLSRLTGIARAAALGGLNGLLPCGLVYSALLIAAASGSPVMGASGMFVFGLGTMPGLVILGAGAGWVSLKARAVLRKVGGVFVLLVGLQLVLRGLAAFGLIPQFPLGEDLLW